MLLGFGGLGYPGGTHGAVVLDDIFSPGLVVLRGEPIPVWGEASPGASIAVTLGGARQTAQADDTGSWRVEFAARRASREPLTLEVTANQTVRVEPVYVGEVFVAAGDHTWRPRGAQASGQAGPVSVFTVQASSALVPSRAIRGSWHQGPRQVSQLAYEIGDLVVDGDRVQTVMLQDRARSRWVWAEAQVRGHQMMVAAPGVDQPGHVRYAWQDQLRQIPNLFGGNGLPVAPFRTDASGLTTAGVVNPDALRRHSLISELHVENPALPRVLLVGDSIAIGQIPTMRPYFAGKANVLVGNHHRGSGLYTTGHALRDNALKTFLENTGPYDVIQFNMGVHEFSSTQNPEGGARGYGQRLRRVVEVFRTYNPDGALIWCSSTGTHGDNMIDRFPLYLSGATAFNAAAAEVMKELDVPITDLFGYTQPRVKEFIGGDLIHLRGEVRREVTEFMAVNIKKALEARR